MFSFLSNTRIIILGNSVLLSANALNLNQSRVLSVGKELIPSQTCPRFLRVCCTSPLKTLWEKEKLLITSNFSFSHSVFCPFGEFSAFFIKFEIVVCKLFQFGRVSNLSIGKGLISKIHVDLNQNAPINVTLQQTTKCRLGQIESICR